MLYTMNSLTHFIKKSTQFHTLASKLFNNTFIIDHYAYRSFNINSIISKYSHYNREKDHYHFQNNVYANWLSHPNKPSIFVSQYNGVKTDKSLLNDIEKINYYIKNHSQMDYSFYKTLNEQNQYLAWTLLFRDSINHIAFLVENIEKTQETIENDFPEYELTNPENPLQISRDNNLLQFAIKAETINYPFKDGSHPIPSTFIEFVERKNGRVGFEGENASKIFDSTKL